MLIKNVQIIEFYELLKENFSNNIKYFPAKISFIIMKNMKNLKNFADEIYLTRDDIIQYYGNPNVEDSDIYIIPEDKKEIAQKELDDLIELEQEVPILKLKFSDIENLEFTMNQMEAIMFMIEEEVE